jgi:phage baseplate assembly protein V
MADDFAKLERRLRALEENRGAVLRWGRVTAVDESAGSARVRIEDADNLVTMPLRVLQQRTLKDQHQELPDIGEHVVCLFAGQGFEQGVVLGAVYSGKEPCPAREPQVWYRRFEDGTELEYDRDSHRLTGAVKGWVDMAVEKDVRLEVEGHIDVRARREVVIESAVSTLIKAPRIHLAGKLLSTDKDGRAGYGEMFGNFHVREGGVKAEHDLLAGDGSVSLLDHLHTGVEPGTGVTDIPVGGGGGGFGGYAGDGDQPEETRPDEIDRILSTITDPVDRLIRCLPSIAAAQAARESGAHRRGWEYLRDMLERWLGGRASEDAQSGMNPYWVDWDWVMSHPRARAAHDQFTAKNQSQEDHNMYNAPALNQLGEILCRDGYMGDEPLPFDFTVSPWPEWKAGYHAHISVARSRIEPDGLDAALAAFTLRSLAKGWTEPDGEGGHIVHVTGMAVFVYDTFNFEEEKGPLANELGSWRCEPPGFSLRPSLSLNWTWLENKDLRNFRSKYGIGEDFLVLSQPRIVDDFQELRYEYICSE